MSSNADLLRPSLTKGWKVTKTFDINRLFLVAFFGGAIPMMILGTRNAKWLNVPKNTINLLLGAGMLIFIGELALFHFYFSDFSVNGDRTPRYIMRALNIILFFFYRFALKKPFQQHLFTNNNEIQPLLKPAILWILIGGTIELALFGGIAVLL
ncbi:hypothetical protein [Bacillus sp. FJAT-27445]|uniref:hypothetical protein n=1 Tax=Bacillus sp. FJAT-27445 TaxID=1679166 RepID=UPI00074453B1|nr:hypothetical protein [Bacillus sp. FJAT-27445]